MLRRPAWARPLRLYDGDRLHGKPGHRHVARARSVALRRLAVYAQPARRPAVHVCESRTGSQSNAGWARSRAALARPIVATCLKSRRVRDILAAVSVLRLI